MTRPRVYPSCPTHELLMYELSREAQELTRILTQWTLVGGRVAKHRATTPELGLVKAPHQDTPPRPRKARTS